MYMHLHVLLIECTYVTNISYIDCNIHPDIPHQWITLFPHHSDNVFTADTKCPFISSNALVIMETNGPENTLAFYIIIFRTELAFELMLQKIDSGLFDNTRQS